MNNLFNFKSYFKFLSRNKAYTAIDVFGLSVSLMFVILIGVYAFEEFSVDKQHTKADRIYALGFTMQNENKTGSHWRIQSKLQSRYPEIEKTCAVYAKNSIFKTPVGENINLNYLLVDSTFYDIFDFQLLRGNPYEVLNAPGKAVITEQCARRLFGNVDPMGKSIFFNDSTTLTVSGIMAPMKNTCIQNINKKETDMVARFELIKQINPSCIVETMDNATGSDIYILTRHGSNLPAKIADMKKYFKTFFWFYKLPDQNVGVTLTPLNKLYFSEIESSSGNHTTGDKKLVNILFTVGLIILLFALMNYINLTVAQIGFRAKEMATRRLLGSSRLHIILRLIAESTLLCIISFVIGLILAFIAAPYASSLLNTPIRLVDAITPTTILLLITIILFTGLLAGIIPALVLSAAKPIEVVRGIFRRRTKMVFSKLFITFQNTITITLIACSLVMIFQIQHLIKAPLGYNTDNIITFNCPQNQNTNQADAFVNQLHQLACVKNVSKVAGTPYDGGNNNTETIEGKTVSFQVLKGDENYMKIFGITLDHDNNLADENGAYVNHQLLSELGLKDNATNFEFYGKQIPIRGILKDFHIRDIQANQHPLILFIQHKMNEFWSFSIQVTGNPIQAYNDIKKSYKEIFNLDLDEDHPFIDQKIQQNYDREIRMSKIVMLFACIAILIALLGLLAMSTYFIQQRSHEIAVRKVFGSTSHDILTKLIRTFLSYVCIAFIITIPIIYHFMTDWLSNYSYRIKLSLWFYVAGGIFCLFVSFVTVFIQSYQAANANPINSIKQN